MNRRIASLFVVCAAALTLLMPGSNAQTGNSGNAFAVGGFTTVDGHMAFAANLTPNGKTSGHVVQDLLGVSMSGPVICATIVGTQAAVVWEVKHSDDPARVGQIRFFDVTDGGEPKMGVSPDLFSDESDIGNRPNCSIGGGGVMPVRGNIVVQSATK